MRISFLDGPLEGRTLALRRAPIFLRGVIDADGKADALDALDDTPRADEQVHVYRRHGYAFVCGRGQKGGCGEEASYLYVPDALGDELRDTARWRAWVDRRAHEEGLIA